MALIKTLEQGRALKAYQFVDNIKKEHINDFKEYSQNLKKLPMLIKTNGLGNSLAFAKAKWSYIYDQISEWILKLDSKVLLKHTDNKELLALLIETDSTTYRAVTVETIALLSWMKRIAEGMKD